MIVWPSTLHSGEFTEIMPQIEFGKETLGLIVRNRTGLRVPINQRSYAWKEGHVVDLFKDLNGAIQASAEEYFLGTIIVVVPDKDSFVEVYDGQQRIATAMILLGAIRDYFFWTLKDEKEAGVITRHYLISEERRAQEVPHFLLSNADREFFVARILREPNHAERKNKLDADDSKESHKRIHEAAAAAAEYVKGITKNLHSDAQVTTLQKWMDYLEKSARVIWVEVKDQATAYRIFETMNDRGLKLSAADLVKNYLYALVPEQNADQVTHSWTSMAAVLESLGPEDGDIVDYIRCFWITTHGQTRSGDLFDNIKKEVNSESTALQWLSTLENRANDYAAILTPSHDSWSTSHQEVKSDVDTLRYLGVSQILPLILAAYGKFSDNELARLIKNAVNWSVRCLVSAVPSGTLEGVYSRNAKAISDGVIKTVDDLVREQSFASLIPRDDAFIANMKTVSIATGSLARYYLRKLQIVADGAPQPEYTPNQEKGITLEHILPQKPSPDWNLPPELMQALYNRLGNLALLTGSVNSRLGNIGFEKKKPLLKDSSFSLTAMVADYPRWEEREIADRQEKLSSYAAMAWPILV